VALKVIAAERNERDPPLSPLQRLSNAPPVPLSVMVFIGTSTAELESLSPEIAEKLAAATMKLLQASSADESQRSLL